MLRRPKAKVDGKGVTLEVSRGGQLLRLGQAQDLGYCQVGSVHFAA